MATTFMMKNGKFLMRNGKFATSRDCCCDKGDSRTCCIAERGSYPANFPPTLIVIISGACCAAANGERTYNRNDTPPLGAGTVQYLPATNMVRCDGSTDVTGNWGLNCGNGVWSLTHEICGQPTLLRVSTPLTLLSCDPLHLVGTAQTYLTTWNPALQNDPQCCVGSFNIEILE